jgi:next-to-BRCA1 protein 1
MYERLLQARLDKLKAAAAALRVQQTEPQNLEQIQRVRKAAVERLLEHRRREHEAALATIKHEHPEVEEPAQQVEEEAAECTLEPHASGSGMIFPQLDKESPESSTYQSSTTAEPRSPVSEKSDVARTVTVASDDEFFEDAESVALHSDEDEGFMTDEEYDILDASDEEMP